MIFAWTLEEDSSVILICQTESHVWGAVTVTLQGSINDGNFRCTMHSLSYLLNHHLRILFPIHHGTLVVNTLPKAAPVVCFAHHVHSGMHRTTIVLYLLYGLRSEPIPSPRLESVGWRVQQPAHALGKVVTNPHTKNLSRRNAVIVEEASQLLAFGWISDNNKHVLGGTGWAVEMAKQRGFPTFLYELTYNEWWQWRQDKRSWYRCEGTKEDVHEPPVLCDTL